MTGWLVTDLYNARSMQPQRSQFDGPRQISINNTEAVKILKHTYYWSAPETYLGNKVSSQLQSKLLHSFSILIITYCSKYIVSVIKNYT